MVSPVGNQQATYNYTKQLLKQNNPTFGDGYWINTVHVNPMNMNPMNNNQTAPVQQATVTNSGCTDGKDDGSIGFFSAVGHALKGGAKFIAGMFTDEQGNFSLGQTLKTLAIGGAIAAASCIPVIGPFVIPAVCALGIADGGCKVVKGLTTALDAKTDAEAKAAWESVGEGATEGGLSYAGFKKVGGFSKAKTDALSQWQTLRPKTQEPITIDAQPVERPQLEAPKTNEHLKLESQTTELATTENPVNPKTGEVAEYDPARARASQNTTTEEPKATPTVQKSETDKFIEEISQKLSNAEENLTPAEKAKVADYLNVSVDELNTMPKSLYKKLSLKYHPDKGGTDAIMQIINMLYAAAKTHQNVAA